MDDKLLICFSLLLILFLLYNREGLSVGGQTYPIEGEIWCNYSNGDKCPRYDGKPGDLPCPHCNPEVDGFEDDTGLHCRCKKSPGPPGPPEPPGPYPRPEKIYNNDESCKKYCYSKNASSAICCPNGSGSIKDTPCRNYYCRSKNASSAICCPNGSRSKEDKSCWNYCEASENASSAICCPNGSGSIDDQSCQYYCDSENASSAICCPNGSGSRENPSCQYYCETKNASSAICCPNGSGSIDDQSCHNYCLNRENASSAICCPNYLRFHYHNNTDMIGHQ